MSEINLSEFALDLTKSYPASPREKLAGYVIAKRTLDKCRATLAGSNGEYHFDCPLDNYFLDFTNISAEAFRSLIASGANDDAVAIWIESNAKRRESREIIAWNNQMRSMRPCDLPIELQEFLEGYIPKFLPKEKIAYVWFDVYDIEEGRI